MLVEGMLVPAVYLVNGISIVKAERVESLTYWHIELDSHDVLIAEGAPSESYVENGNRAMFHNAGQFAALYPDAVAGEPVFCAERFGAGPEARTMKKKLATRAASLMPQEVVAA